MCKVVEQVHLNGKKCIDSTKQKLQKLIEKIKSMLSTEGTSFAVQFFFLEEHGNTIRNSMEFHQTTEWISGGSRITPRWGRELQRVSEKLLFSQFFHKNCMKLKEFGPGGGASLTPP